MAVLYMRNASGRNYSLGTVRLLWTWLWGTCHVPQNACLVSFYFYYCMTGCLCHTNTAFVAKDRSTSPLLTTSFYVCNFLYVIHDVRNFNEHINDIDIRVDNVRGQMKTGSQLKLIPFSWVELSWVESGALNSLKTRLNSTQLNWKCSELGKTR